MSAPTNNQPQSKFKFYRSSVGGLKIQLNHEVTEPGELEYAAFSPVWEKFQGDSVKVGYLKTDNATVQKICESDHTVTEISEKEFKDAVA